MNVRHKLCRHPNCKLVPSYGTEGTRVPVACLEHSDEDMVDLKRARMRMSQAKKTSMPTAARSSSSRGKVAARGTEKPAPTPAVVERVGAGAGAGTAPATVTPAVMPAAVAAVVAGKKRPRAKATQSLGGNAGIGRKIAEAIFASSQRVVEGEAVEAAATEESEWEEDEIASGSGEGNDEDDEEDEEVEEQEEREKEARGKILSTPAGAEVSSEATAMVSPLLPAATSPHRPLPEGTSLSWGCVVCSKPVAPDDRHVLACCGYGLLHKACTAGFVRSAAPCPRCTRLVNSSIQVFV